MILTVSDRDDWLVQEARMAKAKARQERASLVGQWCNEGYITVMVDNDPVNVRLRIEDEFFAEPRDRFPSTTLIAKLQLAIHAGRSDRNHTTFEEKVQAHSNAMMLYGKSPWEMTAKDIYADIAKITGTVKPPRRPRP